LYKQPSLIAENIANYSEGSILIGVFMYDILIVGSGGAGLSSALRAKESGLKVLVVSEGYPTRSQTCMAQGGINAALGNSGEDEISWHIEDTFKSAKGLGSHDMIQKLCKDAPDTIDWLNSIGVPFSRDDSGNVAQRKLGGASASRACYSQDYTGLKILHTLYDQCLKEGIEFLNEHHLLDLIIKEDKAVGAIFLDIKETKTKTISSKSIILATGGYAGIYKSYTTNTNQSIGDGIVVAYRAGAKVSNLEFVQFHPTALKGSGTLISESARGAGGKLVNSDGVRFTDELKARDEVSQDIKNQLDLGKDVFLDIRHLGEEFIDESIPQERKLCISYAGVDPVYDLIPITPAAHYSMGGIAVDENLMSSIDGLFAVGECSNSKVHGANRLGGNSLLEIVSFGRLVASSALEYIKEVSDLKEVALDYDLESYFESESSVDFYKEFEKLSQKLYEQVGITRHQQGLQSAKRVIDEMKNNISNMGIVDKSRVYNSNLLEFIKFKNALDLSYLITKSAIKREESRGAHHRSDFPDLSEDFSKDSVVEMKDED
jgi:succinate dehydrogenase / fumarate reductase flavoprotein subunit